MNKSNLCAVGLEDPKNNINVGHVLRAATCIDADLIAIRGKRSKIVSPTDTTKAWRHIPILRVEDLHDVVPFNCIPIAVDLVEGAKPLNTFHHPKRAFYIFGPEDGTLGKRVTSWCKDVIYIPSTTCLNLAMAVNVVLYDRQLKLVDGHPNGLEAKEIRFSP